MHQMGSVGIQVFTLRKRGGESKSEEWRRGDSKEGIKAALSDVRLCGC